MNIDSQNHCVLWRNDLDSLAVVLSERSRYAAVQEVAPLAGAWGLQCLRLWLAHHRSTQVNHGPVTGPSNQRHCDERRGES